MTQYLIYHGGLMAGVKKTGIVALKATDKTISLRGSRKAVQKWADIIKTSVVIKSSIKDNQIDLIPFINSNKFCSWTFFTDKEFDQFGEVYNKVKGSTVFIKIDSE
jgi:hypothetical protein